MKRILILEDDENLNRGISLKLRKEGYEVLPAYTVREAKDIFENEHVDLVLHCPMVTGWILAGQ